MAMAIDIVQKYIDSALKSEVIEDSFAGYIIPQSFEQQRASINNPQQLKRIILCLSSSQEPEKPIRHYVHLTSQVKTRNKSIILFEMLDNIVKQNNSIARFVCEALLTCDRLDFSNTIFWMHSFEFITRVITSVEYKGVRDILKVMLEKIYSFPDIIEVSLVPQLEALYKTFSMILDREACLLPAYLGLDEVQKKVTQGRAPIWKFAELFYRFIESFRPTAQIVSIVNRSKLLPVVGYSSTLGCHSWRLDSISAKFQLRGLLPYKDRLKEPQVDQLRYMLEQPYSRDMICTILALSTKPRHRCAILEDQLVDAMLAAMQKSESNPESMKDFYAGRNELLFQWQHLSCNLLYFVLFHHASFPHIVDNLYEKLKTLNIRRGREHLMWCLLQYISGSIQKQPLSDFLPVIRLFDLLYPSREPVPIPSLTNPVCTHILAAATTWIHLLKRVETETTKIQRPLPLELRNHFEYLSDYASEDLHNSINNDYRAVLLCNAYSTNTEKFNQSRVSPMSCVVNCFQPSQRGPNGTVNSTPLSITLLDSMTVHSKMSLMHTIATQLIKMAQGNQSNCPFVLSPALIETYSRLLVYTEIESLGMKNLMSTILGGQTAVWRNQAWPIYHVLLEMFTHRLHHVPIHYKVQLLIHLHQLSPIISQANQVQLSMTMEATELKLLMGFSSNEVMSIPQYTPRPQNDSKCPKQLISNDSEELNKTFVLVLARAVQITSSESFSKEWITQILKDIKQVTPLTWSAFTLNCFPPVIKEFFLENVPQKENKSKLKAAVDEEFRKWKAMNNENDIIAHFSQPNAPPLFLCLLWKMLLENDSLSPVVYKILDRIRIKSLSAHLSTFVDYLVFEFANSVAGQLVQRYIAALDDMIWGRHIITVDRLLLCMCLRSYECNETQVCFFIITMLFFSKTEFKRRVQYFVQNNSPEHWTIDQSSHNKFQQQFPEKYYFDCLAEITKNPQASQQALPSYFSNVCLRFLPIFDLLIHRALELPSKTFAMEKVLDHYGCLYKFHDRPITYLYNTLNYYDVKLQDKPTLKRKLVGVILGAFKGVKPPDWCLSEAFNQYLQRASVGPNQSVVEWKPDYEYYIKLIRRLVDTLQNKPAFPHCDWRFNEFQNVKAHALYSTSVELMALPQPPSVVANSLLDIILKCHVMLPHSSIAHWINAIGLVLTALPPSYYNSLNVKIMEYLNLPLLTDPRHIDNIFHFIDFCDSHKRMFESQISYLVALTHSIWHHSNTGQICSLPQFLRDEIKPVVQTESQFLFLCCLVGPFLQRIERSRVMMDVTIQLYEILEKVDRLCDIKHIDTICDLLYHIKYMFTGDAVKDEIERCIKNFKPRLQFRLRFITHLNVNEPR
ncbi:Mediator of RNA polymerase II transcription subunit 23, partial [Fragariocoptes setiger]